MNIPFNIPYTTGREIDYIKQSINNGHLSGNGPFTKKCQEYFEKKWGCKKVLLTTSCTDALEMAAILIEIKPGDEIIMPSFTFVSTALAFSREGALIRFVDSRTDHPGMDEDKIEKLITKKTRAIVVVHYAGVACNMDKIMFLAKKYGLFVIEDAASAINSYYINRDGFKKPLGSIGHLAAFSFHETKNIQCGEGGLLVINDERFIKRSEIIWEKGTNRAEFYRGKINKYSWVDTGSSFLPSELIAAFLWAQIEELENIQEKRTKIWELYDSKLLSLNKSGFFRTPFIPEYATNNAHMFYLICKNNQDRDGLIKHLQKNNILSIFHYLCLHKSKYYLSNSSWSRKLYNAENYEKKIIRLPLYADLEEEKANIIILRIKEFYDKK